MNATGPPVNANAALAKRRRGNQKLAIVEYQLVPFLSNVTGSIFWWAEQKNGSSPKRLKNRRRRDEPQGNHRRESIADFVRSRGHKLIRAGDNFVSRGCPQAQHKRGHCPVTIDVAKQLFHCNDCGIGGTVVDWLAKEKGISVADALRELGGKNDQEPRRKIVCAYDYVDESGKLLSQACRYQPKDFRQRRPDGKGGWIWNLDGVRRVLYRLPELIKAQTVCIPEVEKDCDSLANLGFPATTNPGGALKWRDEYSETLRGKDVVLFRDAGEKGREHDEQRIASLTRKAKSIKQVTLPDGFHDVSDFIESLPTEAAKRAAIEQLIADTPVVPPKESVGQDDSEWATDLSSFTSLDEAKFRRRWKMPHTTD
jgi:hypothetical protein